MNASTPTLMKTLTRFVALYGILVITGGEMLLLAADPPARPPAGATAPADTAAPAAQAAAPGDAAAKPDAPKLEPEKIDSLVAPIALYPDALLAQVLVASTYPLEIVQLQQWMAKNPKLKDKALADAVAKQPWDPSVQSMAAVPEVVKRLADDVQWTTDLGNVFLAQQSDVMDAVQRMRRKAKDKGALESNEQQKVETKKVEDKEIIVVESANPEVIYVPSYSPTVVYGPPVYPYPPIYYPPYPPGAAFVSFSFGVMMGAAFWGGSCCGCGWGGNDIDINVNNNFNRNTNINTGDRGGGNRGGAAGAGGGGKWQHNPSHRGGAPYGNKATADRFGGNKAGGAGANRAGSRPTAASTQQALGRSGGASAGPGGAGAGARSRAGGDGPGSLGGAGASHRGAGGGDRVGSRSTSPGRGGSGAFGGGGGFSGASARSSSARGMSSMGARGGGGRRR